MLRRLAPILATLCLLASAFLPGESGPVGAQDREVLRFVDTDELEIVFARDVRSTTRTVTVQNLSTEPIEISFCVLLEGSSSSCAESTLAVSAFSGPTTLSGPEPRMISLTFAPAGDELQPPRSASGQLVVIAHSPPAAATRPLKIKRLAPSPIARLYDSIGHLDISILVIAIVLALVWLLAIRSKKPAQHEWVAPEIGDSAANFTKGFASSLTSLGAISGTLLASSVLADGTVLISKTKLISLNLLFLATIVVAPLIYSVRQQIESVLDASGNQAFDELGFPMRRVVGKIWLYWVSISVTLFAVFGELLSFSVIIEELDLKDALPFLGYLLFYVLFVVVAILVLIYSRSQVHHRAAKASHRDTYKNLHTGLDEQRDTREPPSLYRPL